MNILVLKRKLSFCIKQNSILFKILEKLNLVVFHWKGKMKMIHPGTEEKNKKYLIIRPQSVTEGLLSSYYSVLAWVIWAQKNRCIPYVDFNSKDCQYYVERCINNTHNAWEYYFQQPQKNLTLDQVMKKKNVIISGWTLTKKISPINKNLASVRNEYMLSMTRDRMCVQPYIKNIVDMYSKENFNGKQVLGVFIRGTDYVSLRPSGHPIQPDISDVIKKIREYLMLYNIDKIFVVTEDKEYYLKIRNSFENMVFTRGYEFAENYKANEYISDSFQDDPYERGLNYLIKTILLTRCNYLISSITNGSLFMYGMKEGEFEDSYWFDLGLYE